MKERPIIFSTESVRAILDGRKTHKPTTTMTEQNNRLRKIADILQRLLTINVHKRCYYCPPMHIGRFMASCKGCAYFDLTNEINELKAEVEKEEQNE